MPGHGHAQRSQAGAGCEHVLSARGQDVNAATELGARIALVATRSHRGGTGAYGPSLPPSTTMPSKTVHVAMSNAARSLFFTACACRALCSAAVAPPKLALALAPVPSAGCSLAPGQRTLLPPGQAHTVTLQVAEPTLPGGMNAREFIVRMPKGSKAPAVPPLIMDIHGYGEDATTHMAGSGLLEKSDSAGVVSRP